jgi:hypothetical protein
MKLWFWYQKRKEYPMPGSSTIIPVYPLYPQATSFIERIALKLGITCGFCLVCGRLVAMIHWADNFRETGICVNCRSTNRQRQIARVLCSSLASWKKVFVRSLADLTMPPDLSIYNTEASGALHMLLSNVPGYISSEYFGPGFAPGELVGGIRHEDLTHLSFPDHSFDFVISSDVLEHVPVPYQAHREIYRVLKPGGRHIFTVPFLQTEYFDDVRAVQDGEKPRLLKPPIYHSDPLQPQGILVYTIFALEMLLKLREVGFRTHMYRLYEPTFGILGPNGLVFEAIKEDGLVQIGN